MSGILLNIIPIFFIVHLLGLTEIDVSLLRIRLYPAHLSHCELTLFLVAEYYSRSWFISPTFPFEI